MSKTVKLLTSALIFIFTLVSCDKNEIVSNNDNFTTFKAELKGSSEVIPNASTAKGYAILTFNNTTKRFTSTTSYGGLTPTSAHIHMASKQENGNVIFPFDGNNTSPSFIEENIEENVIEKQSEDVLFKKKKLFDNSKGNIYFSSPIIYHSGTLTGQQEEALFEGKLYVDFHTKLFPNGEIRGQLEKQ